MNKKEMPPSQEDPSTSPYKIIPELKDAERVLTDQAHRIVIDFLSNPNRNVVVPLIGGVVPLFYTLRHLSQWHPDELDLFLNQIKYLHLSKGSNTPEGNRYNLWFSHPEGTLWFSQLEPILSNDALVIDDIADKLNVAEAMLQTFPGVISFHAAVQKPHTGEKLDKINDIYDGRLLLTTQETVPDEWIASSCGMNEGFYVPKRQNQTEEPNIEDRAYLLSTRQRFAQSGFYVPDRQNQTKEPNIEDRINFFTDEVGMLPDFYLKQDDFVFRAVLKMEILKAKGKYSELLQKTTELTELLSRKARQSMTSNILVRKK